MYLILSCIIQYYKTIEYKSALFIYSYVYMCINANFNVCACHALHCLRPCMHAHMYTWHTNAHVYMTTLIHVVNGVAGNFRVLGCTTC